MHTRQTALPRAWLIANAPVDRQLWSRLRKLPRGSGVILLAHHVARREREVLARKLRQAARARGLVLVDEASGEAARVHNVRELRRALLAGIDLVLLSPLFPTRSHPDWVAVPPMRAAALARLAQRRLIALGGMNAQRFARVQPLGFSGWAGISAWEQPSRTQSARRGLA